MFSFSRVELQSPLWYLNSQTWLWLGLRRTEPRSMQMRIESALYIFSANRSLLIQLFFIERCYWRCYIFRDCLSLQIIVLWHLRPIVSRRRESKIRVRISILRLKWSRCCVFLEILSLGSRDCGISEVLLHYILLHHTRSLSRRRWSLRW